MSNKEIIPIRAFGFVDALQQLQPYLKDNITIDFDTNEYFPQSFGVNFTYTLVKTEPVLVFDLGDAAVESENEPVEDKPVVKIKGRPKKDTTE